MERTSSCTSAETALSERLLTGSRALAKERRLMVAGSRASAKERRLPPSASERRLTEMLPSCKSQNRPIHEARLVLSPESDAMTLLHHLPLHKGVMPDVCDACVP